MIKVHKLVPQLHRVEARPQTRQLDDLTQFFQSRRQVNCRHERRQRQRAGGGGARSSGAGRGRENVEFIHGGGLGGGGLDVARAEGGGAGQGGGELGEIEYGGGALDADRGDVVRTRRHLRCGEGAEPDARFLAGLPDFGYPFAPVPHSDPPVNRVLGVAVVGGLLLLISGRFLDFIGFLRRVLRRRRL